LDVRKVFFDIVRKFLRPVSAFNVTFAAATIGAHSRYVFTLELMLDDGPPKV
jgi:hypothetical protein